MICKKQYIFIKIIYHFFFYFKYYTQLLCYAKTSIFSLRLYITFFLLQILHSTVKTRFFRHHVFFWGSKWSKTLHMPHSLSQLQQYLILMRLHASIPHNDIPKKIEYSLIAVRKMSCNLRYYDSLLVPRVKKKGRLLRWHRKC